MIQCYNCNQWKPGDVAPFAICDECRAGVQSEPAKQQKSFLEMERPQHTTEFVVIVREIETGQDYGECHVCQSHADWQCIICNDWMCDLHEDTDQGFDGSAICEQCGKLSREDRARIVAFREALNQE